MICTDNVAFQCGEKLTESKSALQNSSKGLSMFRLNDYTVLIFPWTTQSNRTEQKFFET